MVPGPREDFDQTSEDYLKISRAKVLTWKPLTVKMNNLLVTSYFQS